VREVAVDQTTSERGPSMADTLTKIRSDVEDHIQTLRDQIEPLAKEHHLLVHFRDVLDSLVDPSELSPFTQVLQTPSRDLMKHLKKKKNGLTVDELAKKMNVHTNYIYRILRSLLAQKVVTRDGEKWKMVA
jgi:biotin operon repressor